MYLQDLIFTLQKFWADRGCVVEQPVDVEVGAGTFHPATFLRALGPEPWNAAFAQFCRRPSDGRYGDNPNRAGGYYQFQVGLKPSPAAVQELYLDSLRAIGLDPAAHDIRFVHDDWESPTLGAWGVGWEVWCDGMEVTQYTYFQQAGGIDLMPVTAELTYGVERLAMYLQGVDNMYDLKWDRRVTYGQIRRPWEVEYSTYQFEELRPEIAFAGFDTCEAECQRLLARTVGGEPRPLVLPAYEFCMKASHAFNCLDARGAISVTERARFIGRVRAMAKACAETYVAARAALGFPLLPPALQPLAIAAYRGAEAAGVNAAALAAARAVAPHAEEVDREGAFPPPVDRQSRSIHPPARRVARDESEGPPPTPVMRQRSPVPADLLFEIGCEEIPAKMLARALAELPALVEGRLAAARLAHAGVRALGTPRRLAVIVKQLVDRQPDLREDVVGPPVSAAFAADGTVTRAGQGFAAKNGVVPEALVRREVAGKKGLYAVAERSVVGRDARALLPDLLVDIAGAIAWPKSQRWGWGETTFVRPVQWLVALYGGEVVPLAWAGATSGRASRGHRFLANRPIEIAAADHYADALRAAHVVVDPDVRRDLVLAELARLERDTGLRVRRDDDLLGEVIHLGEYPVGITGGFDPAFLEVPEELIVTEMRNHQRYFAMEDASGALAPRFATMMATVVGDPAVVQRGNEYVIASRLADARFFFAEDRKKSFAAWNARLAPVVFQAKLGERARTIGAKLARIEAIVAALADRVACDRAIAIRAAQLCKADLASHVVGEFPELQGTMGKHYARLAGEPAAVAAAIEHHYFPRGQGGALPSTVEAAVVAIADRIDTVVGCFAAGLAPSGSADPFGLRRAAIGSLAILLGGPPADAGAPDALDALEPMRITDLIDAASRAYGETLTTAPAHAAVREFFRTRLRGLLIDDGLAGQDVDVVLGVSADDPRDARLRARAVAVVPTAARDVFKRIANILDDARAKHGAISGAVDPGAFASPSGPEARLWQAFTQRRDRLDRALAGHHYRDSFAVLAELGPDVAAFFDRGGVMVMDPDPRLRDNRLSLLQQIHEPFAQIADFRQLGGAA